MTKPLASAIGDIRTVWLERGMDVAYGIACEGRSPFAANWLAVLGVARYSARRLACALLDHDLVDDGYGGPECGCVDINCHRCGFSYPRRWLY